MPFNKRCAWSRMGVRGGRCVAASRTHPPTCAQLHPVGDDAVRAGPGGEPVAVCGFCDQLPRHGAVARQRGVRQLAVRRPLRALLHRCGTPHAGHGDACVWCGIALDLKPPPPLLPSAVSGRRHHAAVRAVAVPVPQRAVPLRQRPAAARPHQRDPGARVPAVARPAHVARARARVSAPAARPGVARLSGWAGWRGVCYGVCVRRLARRVFRTSSRSCVRTLATGGTATTSWRRTSPPSCTCRTRCGTRRSSDSDSDGTDGGCVMGCTVGCAGACAGVHHVVLRALQRRHTHPAPLAGAADAVAGEARSRRSGREGEERAMLLRSVV
jgi:hypothetical protein